VTEPSEIADSVEEVVEGVWHWRIRNANIGGAISSSHAVATEDGCVLIDPVRLADAAVASLPRPTAIALTAKTHQRSAWRYRRELGLEVWLPEDAPPADEEPDRRYAEGDELPGGLLAIRTPGPEWPHYSFLLESGPGVLFCSDLISNEGDGELRFVPPEYHDDPEETRHSVERLLRLPFAVLCLDHGAPIADDPKAALRRLLGD
jgi:glyoxylase-like metal-dependent hydrolase (beta-lactamase superfamily II)